ncbi:MAG: hypothetical protein WAK54_13755 [Bradyrhizobium sp.]
MLGLSVEALPELLTAAERLGFTGLNITYPCKQAVIEHLHKVAPDARAIGVVNTVLFRDGRRSVTIPTGRDLREAFDARFPTSAAIAWLNSARRRRCRGIARAADAPGPAGSPLSISTATAPAIWRKRCARGSGPAGRWRAKMSPRRCRPPTASSTPRRWAWPSFLAWRCRPACSRASRGWPM